jgi:uncharacterized protein (DUF849 family)
VPTGLIIDAALAGNVPTKAQNPSVPVTPQRLASNVELVRGIAGVATAIERRVATPAEARETLELTRKERPATVEGSGR